MRKLRHSKVKNTGLLFELLVKQLATDAIKNTKFSALSIIESSFKGTELGKELDLYRTLYEEKFKNPKTAFELIEAVARIKSTLDNKKIRVQKYNLIKEISNKYDVESFFNTRINDYKVFASIYKILEYKSIDNPANYIRIKNVIAEHITKLESKESKSKTNLILKEDKEMRPLIIKILTDKFNNKYSRLNLKQKSLLRHYINNITDSGKFRNIILQESEEIAKKIDSFSRKVDDKTIKIKLNEVKKIVKEFENEKIIKQRQIVKIMRFYDLIEELENITNTNKDK